LASTRAVRDPDRRERILSAAAELIAQRGYLGVNLTDIGTAAGIVGSGIYRHFDSKAAILVAMFDRVVDRLIADAEALLRRPAGPDGPGDPAGTLAALVRDQVRFTITERKLCQVYLEESRNLPAGDLRRLRWKQRHYIDLWVDVLGTVRPELTVAQRQVVVHAAIAGIQSVLRHHSQLPEPELAALLASIARDTLGLLGAIRQGEGVAAQVLSELGADLDPAREQVIRLLGEHRRKHGHQS
jgi:AcrR family transcriptional regulator